MKTKFYSIAFLFAISLIFASCHKDDKPNEPNNDINDFLDLKVSESFAFESFSDLSTDIKIPMTKASGVQIIQIFDADPTKGGKVILTGSVNENGEFKLPIRIASRLKEVYVGKLSSTGNNEFVPVAVVGSIIQLDFTNTKSTDDNDPCTTGCTTTLTSSPQDDLTVANGEIYCIDEYVSITFNNLTISDGGTLRVCGSASINSFSGNGSGSGGDSGTGTLLINSEGSVNLPSETNELIIDNYGTLNYAGGGGGSGGDDVYIEGTLNNWGDIESSIKVKIRGTVTNNANFTLTDGLEIKSEGELINNCQIYIGTSSKSRGDEDFKQEGAFTNNGYVHASGKVELKGDGEDKTILGPGSLILSKDFIIKGGEVQGPSTSNYAQIKATDKGEVDDGWSVTGFTDVCSIDAEYDEDDSGFGDDVEFCNNTVSPPICGTNVAPSITSSTSLGGLANVDIELYTMTATGTEEITYTMGALPTGLTWDGSTRTITGSAAAGIYPVSMTAQNFMGSDTKTLVITITQPTAAPTIISVDELDISVEGNLTYELEASGTGPIEYALTTDLPDGLSYNENNHTISGSPDNGGFYNIGFTATNDGGTTAGNLGLTVGTPPTITNTQLTAIGTAGVQFNTYTVTATGSPTIEYIASGLQSTLIFDANTQTINGTPVSPGEYDVSLIATNDYGSDNKTLHISISAGLEPPDITSATEASGQLNFPFTYTISALGSQPMEFVVSILNLPEGLIWDGNSDISGIPTEDGTFNITITADNDAGHDEINLEITIGTGSNVDTDGDGIYNNLDAYPNDPTRAFNSYYPNQTDYGSFAFEDLWPGYGDYDFNDFVVNFNYQMVTNAQNEFVDVITKFQIMAAGASQNNGFGIEFDVPSSTVQSVTGCMKFGNAVQIDPNNGCEVGPSSSNKTVIIPFDAINPIMEGGLVNTVPGGRYIQTIINTVTTTFSTAQASIGNPPFNPFIFVNQIRGYEIHLKNQPPTELVDPAYFDTYSDVSNQSSTFYISETGLPWAIEVPVNFNYPKEKADILTAYLKFAAWAQSDGVDFPDWYQDEAGYRNDANIYVIPSSK
jgi:LruC domain-containing protein